MIAITERAAKKIQELLTAQEDPDLCLRLYVTKGGCEGFTYGMAFDRERREDDQVIDAGGIRVLVDPLTLRLLRGAQIDYVRSMMGEGFTVRNPNAVSTCGCGHSFKAVDDPGEPDPCDQALEGN